MASSGYSSLTAPATGIRKWRGVKNGISRYFVGVGGVSVIIALGLIFLYLFIEVVPLFRAASIEHIATYPAPGSDAPTLHVAMERYMEVGVRFAQDGSVTFFDPATGEVKLEEMLPIPEGVEITSFGAGEPRTQLVAVGLSNGEFIIVQHDEDLSYPDDVRLVTPKLVYPFDDKPMAGDDQGRPITSIGVQQGSGGTIKAAISTDDGRLRLIEFSVRRTLFATETTRNAYDLDSPDTTINRLMISMDMADLLVGDAEGYVHYYRIRNPADAQFMESQRVVSRRGAQALGEDPEITTMKYLLGTVSLVVGGSDGSLTQWMLVRDDENVRRLTEIRSFTPHEAPISSINPEYSRKGFVTADDAGNIGIHFSTSHRTLLSKHAVDDRIRFAMLSPRANGLFLLDESERLHYYLVRNDHPQTSFHALWQQVWYEGYEDPQYRWESSSATDEFEPKFSLVPLTVGTLKAAFYAMLFATPLAIMGAIYTAYFMTPKLRGIVKPSIEIMEALPTVILGFLAGLWFAPFVENHLPAVFSVLILMPLGILLFGLLWSMIPAKTRSTIPPGWEAAILVPVIIFIGWACVKMSPLLDVWFFGGDMRQWFTDIGLTYDQRNALVVGIAMGFAVIPTIFSITEDAIFNVPKHLTQGSLALGATPWQTMMKIVILTASPGIFSAVMIGLGRAVGETMIVLMATGNSPVTNFNIFEGMRTLSANIAVEMGETEVGGTHYRILFLSALVLFALTFVFNTIAEIVRQRLRKKYASI
ncbi:MAG: ABC transporter permease subunit [Phycisphaerales bacterium]|nr:MAG: ABC transporter permease subunit [Phycisphaerales bacterium]